MKKNLACQLSFAQRHKTHETIIQNSFLPEFRELDVPFMEKPNFVFSPHPCSAQILYVELNITLCCFQNQTVVNFSQTPFPQVHLICSLILSAAGRNQHNHRRYVFPVFHGEETLGFFTLF